MIQQQKLHKKNQKEIIINSIMKKNNRKLNPKITSNHKKESEQNLRN